MRAEILRSFPPSTHPLTVVSDPDSVLGEGPFRDELRARGFQVIDEADPVVLRIAVQQVRPFTTMSPVVVVTTDPLSTVPYDLWQMGQHVDLSLSRLHLMLAPGPLRELSRLQLWRLDDALQGLPPIGAQLTMQSTQSLLLRALFGINCDDALTPANALQWLLEIHARQEPLPKSLATILLNVLRQDSTIATWPLQALMQDQVALSLFIASQFRAALLPPVSVERVESEANLHEASTTYNSDAPQPILADFARDTALQDLVPRLVREKMLSPIVVGAWMNPPDWAKIAVMIDARDQRPDQLKILLASLRESLTSASSTWEYWKTLALRWADVTRLRYMPDVAIES